jgi:hypothetical protein
MNPLQLVAGLFSPKKADTPAPSPVASQYAPTTQAQKDANAISQGAQPGYEAGLSYVGGRGSMGSGVMVDSKGTVTSTNPYNNQTKVIKTGVTTPQQAQNNYNASMTTQNIDALWKQTHPGEGDRPAGWNGDSAGGGGGQSAAQKLGYDFTGAEDMLAKYSDGARKGINDYSEAEIKLAEDRAMREYNTVMDALNVQKGEVATQSAQQRQRLDDQKALTQQELVDKQNTEQKTIDKQVTQTKQDYQSKTESLAKSWRDTSLYAQRVARAAGIQDSGFAVGNEQKMLTDFNQGLRTLSTQNQSALNDFADATIETDKFYQRQQASLDTEVRNAKSDIDTWERTQIQSINNQSNLAQNKRLDMIATATSQANQAKMQVEQNIADKQLALGTYLIQMQQQYKLAVATAAQGKVQSAADQIAQLNNQAKLIQTGLEMGTLQYGKNQNGSPVIHGYLPGTNSYYEQATTEATGVNQDLNRAKTLNTISGANPNMVSIGNQQSGTDILNSVSGLSGGGGNIYGNPIKDSYQQ